jgi:hypothetical protein
MIPESLFPDLAAEVERRSTAPLMARQMVERLVVPPLVRTFTRVTDGALIDYQLSRVAYYMFLRDPSLGSTTPISSRLVPYLHHIENCVTNTVRALHLCDGIRRLPPGQVLSPLVSKVAWRPLDTLFGGLSDMRHAIQHVDDQLRQGVLLATAMLFDDAGKIVFGTHTVVLVELAEALRALNGLAVNAAQIVPKYVGP